MAICSSPTRPGAWGGRAPADAGSISPQSPLWVHSASGVLGKVPCSHQGFGLVTQVGRASAVHSHPEAEPSTAVFPSEPQLLSGSEASTEPSRSRRLDSGRSRFAQDRVRGIAPGALPEACHPQPPAHLQRKAAALGSDCGVFYWGSSSTRIDRCDRFCTSLRAVLP